MAAMRKIFIIVITLLMITLAAVYIMPPPSQDIELKPYLIAVSSDGAIRPGQQQELMVYVFSHADNQLVREQRLDLKAVITMQSYEQQQPSILEAKLHYLSEGAYTGIFKIPENIKPGSASIEIYHQNTPSSSIHSCKIPVREDQALIVIPPSEPVYAGNWVSFKIASVDKKSGTGAFKKPVRVKLHAPNGHTTINRLVHTDLDGTAVFTTHINNNTRPGIYIFEFTQGSERVKISILVDLQKRNNDMLTQRFNWHGSSMLPLSTILPATYTSTEPQKNDYMLVSQDLPNNKSLYDIRSEKKQAFLNYNCEGSTHRQIEVWQNGKAVYTSDLQLESGRISIPFSRGVKAGQPLFFKLWQLKQNKLRSYGYTTIVATTEKSPVSVILNEADKIITPAPSQPFTDMLFSQPGWMSANMPVKISSIKPQSPVSIEPEIIREADFAITASDALRLLQCDTSPQMRQQRFFLVENELQLNRYRFSTLKIWLDPERFFRSVISALHPEKSNIDLLIGEVECRTMRCDHSGISEKPAELEKLEGLMLPLSEFYDHTQISPAVASAVQPLLMRAMARMHHYIHIPRKIRDSLRKSPQDISKIGPFSPVLPFEISVDRLFEALKPGGKATLVSDNSSIQLNLVDAVAIFKTKNISGKEYYPDKLLNSRNTPILVELEFTEPVD